MILLLDPDDQRPVLSTINVVHSYLQVPDFMASGSCMPERKTKIFQLLLYFTKRGLAEAANSEQ